MMELFDNRELALLGWIVVLLVWGFTNKKTRETFLDLLKTLFAPKLLALFIPLIAYSAGVVYLLNLAKVWTPDLISETVFWFFGPAAVLFSRFTKAGEDPHFLRRAFFDAVRITVIIEFLLNAFPFSLGVEVFLVPVLVLVGGLLAISSTKPEYARVKRMLDVLVAFLGWGFLAYATARIIQDPAGFASLENGREFVVPLVLTIALLPFVYLVAVVSSYEMLFLRLRWKLKESPFLGYAKWRAFRWGLLRLRRVHRLSTELPARIVASSSRNEIDQAARQARKV